MTVSKCRHASHRRMVTTVQKRWGDSARAEPILTLHKSRCEIISVAKPCLWRRWTNPTTSGFVGFRRFIISSSQVTFWLAVPRKAAMVCVLISWLGAWPLLSTHITFHQVCWFSWAFQAGHHFTCKWVFLQYSHPFISLLHWLGPAQKWWIIAILINTPFLILTLKQHFCLGF